MTEKKNLRAPFLYSAFSLLVLLFGMIYTYFGHGVRSDYMTFAFLPLQLAAFVYLGFAVCQKIPRPERFSAMLLAFAVASFTLNGITKGILQIAGAYSDYSDILHIAAIACLAIAVILYPVEIVLKKKTSIHTKE